MNPVVQNVRTNDPIQNRLYVYDDLSRRKVPSARTLFHLGYLNPTGDGTFDQFGPSYIEARLVTRLGPDRLETPLDDIKWLMAREIPRLRRYAFLLTDNQGQADDLVQDCLERAIRKHSQLKKHGSVRAWLMRILYTRWIDETKRHRNALEHVPIENMEHQLAVAPGQNTADTRREILAAVKTLPPNQKAALGMVVIEGMSYDEAAVALNIPIGTVRSRLARARETLRAAIDDDADEGNDLSPATVTPFKRIK